LDLIVFALLAVVLLALPATKWFERGRYLYLRRPNPYICLYDLPGIEHWIPTDDPPAPRPD
jgi:hypothetical protein